MRVLFFISFSIFFGLSLKAQNTTEHTEGTVSFLSSQNIYVKYKSTEGIIIGDTLYSLINNNLTPSLIVKNLSSTSIVCSPLSLITFNVNDKIIANRRIENKKPEKIIPIITDTIATEIDTTKTPQIKSTTKKQEINGRISVSSYTNFSNTPAKNSFVANYALTLNVNNMNSSKFSLESNILLRQENGKWNDVKNNIFNGLKIYDLALKYNVDKNTFFSFGRKNNPHLSNLGWIDGLQVEKSFNDFFVGGFVGSRPNYVNYGFDFNLFNYGAYFGHSLQTPKKSMQNSISIVEQTNKFYTDRRFFTFQHNNSLIKNVSIFYTLELDLFKIINESKQNTVSLTNNYFSLRYQPFKRLTLSGTYDSRKNIIYYETDKNFLSTLIADEARQGFSTQINYKIARNLFIGVKAGSRFKNKDIRDSRNAYAFVTYNNMFKSKLSSTFSSTMLETIYLNGNIYNLSFSRGFDSDKTNISIGYSYVRYNIIKAELPLIQHIAHINFSKSLKKQFVFSLNFESNFENINKFYRVYVRLSKRF